jgi:hypothetical protein
MINFNHGGNRPKYFRLPASSQDSDRRDPFFGFTRGYYYEGEERGYWKLVRLIEDGKQRGVTLVPYDAVERFVAGHDRNATSKPQPGKAEAR